MFNKLDDDTRATFEAVATGKAGRRTMALETVRSLAKRNGYESAPGGYVKNIATGGTVAHGWQIFAQHVLADRVPVKTAKVLDYEAFTAAWTATTDEVRESRWGRVAAENGSREDYVRALSWLRSAIEDVARDQAIEEDEAWAASDQTWRVIGDDNMSAIARDVKARAAEAAPVADGTVHGEDDMSQVAARIKGDAAYRDQVTAYAEVVDQFAQTGFGHLVSAIHRAEFDDDPALWDDAAFVARGRVLGRYLDSRESGPIGASTGHPVPTASATPGVVVEDSLRALVADLAATGCDVAAANVTDAARRLFGITLDWPPVGAPRVSIDPGRTVGVAVHQEDTLTVRQDSAWGLPREDGSYARWGLPTR